MYHKTRLVVIRFQVCIFDILNTAWYYQEIPSLLL